MQLSYFWEETPCAQEKLLTDRTGPRQPPHFLLMSPPPPHAAFMSDKTAGATPPSHISVPGSAALTAPGPPTPARGRVQERPHDLQGPTSPASRCGPTRWGTGPPGARAVSRV